MATSRAPGAASAPVPGDADALIAAAEAALDAAGAIIRPAFRSGLPTERKADRSPVTAADRDAEHAMRAVLEARFPADGIWGEEGGRARPGARRCWVLDPIDGTRAFVTGRPLFGTLLALLEDGVPLLGAIDQPVLGERWLGVAGQPTRFRGGLGGAVGTRRCVSLAAAELSCTSPDLLGPHAAAWERLARQVARVSWGGDCYAYGLLALGQIDLVCECGLKPWDWAALVPVVEGAGGRITDWNGAALRPDGDGRVLAAGDPALHAEIVASQALTQAGGA